MKKENIVIIVLLCLAVAGIAFYFYKKKKGNPTNTQTKIADAPPNSGAKSYDSQFKALSDEFFKNSELGNEQAAAVFEATQENMNSKGLGKVDAFVATVAQWVPAWLSDTNLTDKYDKIKTAWDLLYNKHAGLKMQEFQSK